ncbi:hypothetical protein AHAS_Ahas02G0196900 [Arachis hypogaea]
MDHILVHRKTIYKALLELVVAPPKLDAPIGMEGVGSGPSHLTSASCGDKGCDFGGGGGGSGGDGRHGCGGGDGGGGNRADNCK